MLTYKDQKGNNFFYVAGIAGSMHPECAIKGMPVFHTKVGSYIDWIKANVEP